MALTSAELETRLDEALAAQADADRALDRLRAAAVVLDEDEGPEERQAVETARRAKEQADRLIGALQQLRLAESAERRRLAAVDRAARDAQTVKIAEQFEAAATAMDKAVELYVKAWLRLVETTRSLQGEITQRQDALRRDLRVPPLTPLVESRLFALTPFDATIRGAPPSAPGARANGLVRDVARIPSVADALGSLATAVREDIARSRPVAEQTS